MSKAPRADIALLRRVKSAREDPGFVPSQLLNNGDAMLDRANKLKGFLKNQLFQQDSVSAKTEWLLTYQKLQDESEAAEKELMQAVQAVSSQKEAWVAQILEASGDLNASSLECKMARQQLRLQMKGLTEVVQSLMAYGPEQLMEELEAVGGELGGFSEQLCGVLEELLEQSESASEAIQANWPSALHHSEDTPTPPESLPPSRRSSLTASMSAPESPRPSTSGRGEGGGVVEESEALEQLLGQFVLEDTAVGDSVRGAYRALRVGYVERMTVWRRDYDASWKGSGRSTGGWAAEEHSAFVRLYKEAMRDLETRGGRDGVVRRIAVLLPNRRPEDVARHETWYTAHRLLQRRYKDLKSGWARDLEAFMSDTRQYLQSSQQLLLARAEAAADRLEWEVLREMKGGELDERRRARAAELEVVCSRRRAEEEAAAALAAEEDGRWRLEVEARREAVGRYREDKERRRREAEEAAAVAAHEAALQVAAEGPQRQQRLEYRRAEQMLKLDRLKGELRQQQEELEARQRRLDRLRAQVQPQVEADPARLMAPTVSSLADGVEEGRAFHPVHGFTTQHMLKDPRFKITEALMAAGLHCTDYGRQVITAARTTVPTRPDNLTSFQQAGASEGGQQ